MLCFSHGWTGDPLSKTHLMRLFSRENRVLWVNSIGNRTPTASTRDLKRIAKKAKDFADSADLKEAMIKAGVLDTPTIYFLESID